VDRIQRITNKKHLFFDLDHTLWDYEANSRETLTELWSNYDLTSYGVSEPDFLTQFEEVNNRLWDQYHRGEIGKDTIRNDRFRQIFDSLAASRVDSIIDIQEDYLSICPTKPYVIDGAIEILKELAPHYQLHIITNGFDEIQSTKLSCTGLVDFFDVIVTSGTAGFQKQQVQIFDFALQEASATANESVMIGDNPLSDIEGAADAGIAQIFYNPGALHCPVTPTAEIKSLRELPAILL
jgi:putative hydrolase of the HAD superfamily